MIHYFSGYKHTLLLQCLHNERRNIIFILRNLFKTSFGLISYNHYLSYINYFMETIYCVSYLLYLFMYYCFVYKKVIKK